jgi:hypothetical protein
VLFPLARVRTVIFIFIFFTIVTLPAIVLIGLWFLLQFFDGVAALSNVQQGMGGVAYFAHIGGFVTGLVITLLLRPWLRPPASVSYPYMPRHPDATVALNGGSSTRYHNPSRRACSTIDEACGSTFASNAANSSSPAFFRRSSIPRCTLSRLGLSTSL